MAVPLFPVSCKNKKYFHLFHSLDNLNNILIIKNMIFANSLRLMFDWCSPYKGVLQILDDGSVDFVAEVLNSAVMCL